MISSQTVTVWLEWNNMKSFNFFLMTVLSAGLFSCSVDNGGDVNEGPAAPYTLSVDKDAIESDGKDRAVFTITDANGMELTGGSHLKKTSFHIQETDEWKSGMILDEPNVLTSINDGTYTVDAMYDGVKCANEVEVTSVNRSKYEVFHKNVALYRFTGTWCQYCPGLTESLGKIDGYTEDHVTVLEFHKDDEFSIAALSAYLKTISGVPYSIYSLDYATGGVSTPKEIRAYVKEQLVNYPAMTGIKATSSVSGNTLTVNATVKASKSGDFDLGMAILKDNCVPSSSGAYEEVYNDVVISISGNYRGMSEDGTFTLKADGEKSVSWEMSGDIFASEDAKDCKVALFTLTSYDGKVVIDNVVTFKVGEGIPDYRLN